MRGEEARIDRKGRVDVLERAVTITGVAGGSGGFQVCLKSFPALSGLHGLPRCKMSARSVYDTARARHDTPACPDDLEANS